MSAKPFTAELQRLGLPLRHAAHVEPETPAPVPALASPTVIPGATPAEFMAAIGRI
jgi:chemotaxis protein CheZ